MMVPHTLSTMMMKRNSTIKKVSRIFRYAGWKIKARFSH
jgi:hypothetical protein